MAKVTEQDLIKLGFKRKWFDDKSGYWFEKRFKHNICGKLSIEVITDRPWIGVILHINDEMFREPLTTANLDLFIRFAKGEKL